MKRRIIRLNTIGLAESAIFSTSNFLVSKEACIAMKLFQLYVDREAWYSLVSEYFFS